MLQNISNERGDTMAKTANLYVRIEPTLKEQAEEIFEAIGLPPSSAITMFYKQVVMQQGLPFEAKISYKKPLDVSCMTREAFDKELEKGYQDIVNGNVISAEEVFTAIREEFSL